MNLQFYLEKLKNSEEFKKFIEETPNAFLCSAFFSIDKSGADNKQHLDYFAGGKIFSFQIEENCKMVQLENFKDETPAEIFISSDFELKEIENLIIKKIAEEKIEKSLQKILLSVQNIEGAISATGTAFISGMGMINLAINLKNMRIVSFEKKSIFDMINILKK